MKGAAVLLLLLPVLIAQERTLDELVARLAQAPDDGRAWHALRTWREPGRALMALRGLPASVRETPDGWRALGRLADGLSDYALVVRAGRAEVAAARTAGDLVRASDAEVRLGDRHLRYGATEAGIAAYERARAMLEEAGEDTEEIDGLIASRDLGRRPDVKADVARHEARVERARRAGDEKDLLGALRMLGIVYWREGRHAEGLEAFREALGILDELGVSARARADTWNGAARLAADLAVQREGEERRRLLEQARGWAERALAAHESSRRGNELLLRDHCVLAHVTSGLGLAEKARRHFEAELRLVRSQRRIIVGDTPLRVFHGERHHVFDDYALFLCRRDPPELERAVRISEESRLGALRELLAFRGGRGPAWMDDPSSLAELRAGARAADAALLVFLAGSHEGGTIVITGEGTSWHPLGPLDRVDAAAADFAAAAADLGATPAEVQAAGRTAFEGLLAPSRDAWKGHRRLVLAGTGRWSRVPFGALVVQEDGSPEQRCLASAHEVVVTPSLTSLAVTAEPKPRPRCVTLGFSGAGPYDPVLARHFRMEGLAPLRRAADEARRVARALGGAAFVGEHATETVFAREAPRATILHVAAHALVDDEDPRRSAVLLAPEDGVSDGFLTLGELTETPLQARLVVLSGCRTALGRGFHGEGIRGMARALLVAGAGSVLVSVLPVDDQTAPIFLERLVADVAGGRPLPEAFAASQRHMLARRFTSHPALWAGWILYGQSSLFE